MDANGYIMNKAIQLLDALHSHELVGVCGPSLSGKTLVIEAAAATLEHAQGVRRMVEPDRDTLARRIAQADSVRDEWLVIDGDVDAETAGLLRQISRPHLVSFFSSDQMLPPFAGRVLLECARPSSTLADLPIHWVRVGEGADGETPSLPLTLLTHAHNLFNAFRIPARQGLLLLDKIFSHFEFISDEHLHHTALFIVIQAFTGFSELKQQFHLLKARCLYKRMFDAFPTRRNWIELRESSDLSVRREWLSHACHLSMRCGLIATLVGEDSDMEGCYQAVHRTLREQGWTVTILHVTPRTHPDELRHAMTTCKILFGDGTGEAGGDLHLGGRGALLLRGDTGPPLWALLRQMCHEEEHLSILVGVRSVSDLPERMRRHTLPLHTDNAIKTEAPTYSMEKVYTDFIESSGNSSVLMKQLYDLTPQADIRRLLIRLASERAIPLSVEETDEELPLHRVGTEVDLRAAVKSYAKKVAALSLNPLHPVHSLLVTSSMARRLALLQTAIDQGANVILESDSGCARRQMVHLCCSLIEVTCEEYKENACWDTLIEKALRTCLLEGQRVCLLLCSFSSSILDDLVILCVRRGLPTRFLSQQLLSEFSEKHTLEGAGIWEKTSARLSESLSFCLLSPTTHSLPPSLLCSIHLLIRPLDAEDRRQCAHLLLKKSEEFPGKQLPSITRRLCLARDIVEKKGLPVQGRFIEFIHTYVHLVKKKREKVEAIITRYEKGMEKLRKAEEQMGFLQGELLRLQPELVRTSIETSMLMSSIERETIEVENAREVVAANEHKANEAATKAQAIKAECELEVANAIPALEAAIDSLETMKQSDVSSLKTMRFPPYGVRLCMEAVCILLGELPARVPDQNGVITLDYWVTGQKLLSDLHFLTRIRTFPRDKVSRKTMHIIRENYLSKDEFDPEIVKQCSLAAEGLCLWVKAIDIYNRIAKVVEPKREKLRKAELLVKTHMKQLDLKRKALQKVTEKLQSLSDQFSQMSQRKQELQSQILNCEVKMDRAERLVVALGGEKEKWEGKMEEVRAEAEIVIQEQLKTAVLLEYLAHVPTKKRKSTMRLILLNLYNESDDLPPLSDQHILLKARRPVVICDTQKEAISFLSGILPNKIVVNSDSEELSKNILSAIADGSTLVVENIGATLPPLLVHLLNMRVVEEDGKMVVIIDGEQYPYSVTFRLVLISTLPPEKIPSLLAHSTTLIHLQHTNETIRTRVLDVLGRRNWPALVEERNQLKQQIESDLNSIEKMEEDMLDMLGRSQDLDDDRAIELLSETRTLTEQTHRKQMEMEKVEESLHQVESQVKSAVDWACECVILSRSLLALSTLYHFSFQQLFAALDTPLLPGVDILDGSHEDALKKKISSLFWETLASALTNQHKTMLHCILFNQLDKEKLRGLDLKKFMESKKEMKKECTIKDLGMFIWKQSNRVPILLSVDASVSGYPEFLHPAHSRGIPVIHTIVKPTLLSTLGQQAELAIWLAVHNVHLEEHAAEIGEIIDTLSTCSPHLSFRLLLLCPTPSASLLLERVRLYSLCLPSSLSSFLDCLCGQLSSIYSELKSHARHSLLRIIAFHYALTARCEYRRDGFHSGVTFTDIQLRLAVQRYKDELRGDGDMLPLGGWNLFEWVIRPVYQLSIASQHDRSTLRTLFTWVFEGLNKRDDQVLASVLPWVGDRVDLMARWSGADTRAVCGLHPNRIDRQANRKANEALHAMKSLFSHRAADDPPVSNREEREKTKEESTAETATIENYLAIEMRSADEKNRAYFRSLSPSSPSGLSLDATRIRHPIALISTLRIQYAASARIPISEVDIFGDLSSSLSSMTSLPSIKTGVLLTHCSLQGCSNTTSGLDEIPLTHSLHSGQSVLLTAGKRLVRPDCLSLLSSTGEVLCTVSVKSAVPIQHWNLRGAAVILDK